MCCAEHEAVDRERVLARREELRELHRGRLGVVAFAFEDVVLAHLAAVGQRAAMDGDPFDLAAQLHFLAQQRVACLAIGRGLVGEMQVFQGHDRQTSAARDGLP
jgi:hypothetical protein